MINKEQYEALKAKNREGLANNDYNKMIMIGSDEYNQMKEYEQHHCKHPSFYVVRYGTGERCQACGKIFE